MAIQSYLDDTGLSMEIDTRVERVDRLEPYQSERDGGPWHQSPRARLFFVVFIATLLVGLVYTLLQPSIYRSDATVLMSAPQAIDAGISEADIQRVAIQRRVLLGEEIIGQVVEQLYETGISLDRLEVRSLLYVDPVPETNLVEMYAQGSNEDVLPILVNDWIDVYLSVRSEDIEQRKRQTQQQVQDELEGLSVRLTQARSALNQYREEHEIISMERQENEVLSRLDGLNSALNNAIEEEAKTRAYLDTLEMAISRGAPVVPQDERSAVDAMDGELRELRAQLVEMNKRYTEEYIQKDPRLRAIPERIAELEAALAQALGQGRQAELANARHAYAAASQTVLGLQMQLDEHKQAVAAFNTVYATHEALVEDLAELEQLNRETQSRLVQVEVRQLEKYPQVSVIERPGPSSERIGPDYLLLLGGTVTAAVVLGIFSVWLMSFLTPDTNRAAYVTVPGVAIYPSANEQLVGGHRAADALQNDTVERQLSRDFAEGDLDGPRDRDKPD